MTASGFYHCSVKGVGRAKGRSVVAAAAYRAGERLHDEITGLVQDYQLRHGVLDTFILTPQDAPSWAHDRGRLWNEAERAEPRANGRLATELELALPHELTDARRKALLIDYLRPLVEKHGVAVDVAIHAPGEGRDHRNVHAHVLVTHRELGPEGFGDIANTRTQTRKRKGKDGQQREVTEKIAGIAATPADIRAIRQGWEKEVNRAYERAGLDLRVDHRSHEDRGIEQEPSKHLGPTAAAMERRGVASERGDLNRDITQRNVDRRLLKALDAEARRVAAAIIELEAGRANADTRQAASDRYNPVRDAQREAIDAEQRANSETGRVFRSATARIVNPPTPSFDRDAADAAWMEKVAAAGIAKDEAQRAAPETRQQAPPASATRTPDPAPAPSGALPSRLEHPVSQVLDTARTAAGGASKASRGLFGGLGKALDFAAGLFEGLFAAPKPPPTKQEVAQAAQAQCERQATAAIHQQAEAHHEMLAEQQRTRDIARTMQIEVTGDPEEDRFRQLMKRATRDNDRDREHEHERER
ncbi:MAG: MobQ family relaxase [Acetobacteraceae bacterium]